MGGALGSPNSKCQDLSKFQFSGGKGVLGSQNLKCQDLPKFPLGVFGGGGVLWEVKTQSAKIYLNFNWGGGVLGSQNPRCQARSV